MTEDRLETTSTSDDGDRLAVHDGEAPYELSARNGIARNGGSGSNVRIDRMLAAIARGADETGATNEAVLTRLEAAAAFVTALTRLEGTAVMEDENMKKLDTQESMPRADEVRQAIDTLLAFTDGSLRTEWRRTVDTLISCPSLDIDQLYQAQRHAERRRRLLSELTFAGATDFARLLPNRIELGGNIARTLARLRTERRLLAMKIKGDWKYPIVQIGGDGDVFAQLPSLLGSANDAGYDSWEILHWLVTPLDEPHQAMPGQVLPDIDREATAEDIALAAMARHGLNTSPSVPTGTPLALLRQGNVIAFEGAVKQWLG